MYKGDGECPTCGGALDVSSCWRCHGEGGYHDCGEDSCCCLYPDEDDWYPCEECGGTGDVWFCPDVALHAKDVQQA